MAGKILLVGNPNVGKSSLFNILTGTRQKTGNYDGVTVEKKEGFFNDQKIIDLPGLSSLWSDGVDERIAIRQILSANPAKDRILFIADGMKMQNNMVLFSQLADLQIPMAMVINFKDELEESGVRIDVRKLQNKLACPVVLFNARKGHGLEELQPILLADKFRPPNAFIRTHYEVIDGNQFQNRYATVIEDYINNASGVDQPQMMQDLESRNLKLGNFLQDIVTATATKKENEFTDRLDRILLHPIWGSIIFLLILFLVFQALFSISAYPMDLIDRLFGDLSAWASRVIQPGWLAGLIGDGLIPGIGGVVIFIPQIAILFILLGILESTGYLSRLSYLSDRWLKGFGLSGTSAIPLMSGLACAIPAVMSTKRIRSERERLAAILVTPFMTCSARLPVYTILIALIFPDDAYLWIFNVKGLMLLGMYLLGTFTSLIASWVISRFNKETVASIWMMELPRYRWPHWRNVFIETWTKTKAFVLEAGKVILIFSMILWALAAHSPQPEAFIQNRIAAAKKSELNLDDASIRLEYSYAGYMGKVIEPFIKPLGYDWKIGIALISSFAAREVFVGTISTIYSIGSDDEGTVIERLRSEKRRSTNEPRFNLATCISLLLFYAFAMQCMSTLAIVKRETGTWKWPIIQFIGMMILAYVSALIAYQLLQ